MTGIIELTKLRTTPVLSVKGTSSKWQRIYGATLDKVNNRWLFPAVPPFIDKVLHDINKVHNLKDFTDNAEEWIDGLKTLDEWKDIVNNLQLPIASYEHQLDGLAELLFNYRWVLNWKMGTGKTKIAIDAISYLQRKTLVLCPLIAVGSWELELQKFAVNTLKVMSLTQTTPKAKKNAIKKAIQGDYDVLITTYDNTRNLGYPHIDATVYTYCTDNRLVLHDGLRKPLKRISSGKKQLQFIIEWHKKKRKPASIREEIKHITKKDPVQWVNDFDYDIIVADESHRMKNHRRLKTKACKNLALKASRRYLLTGTLSQGDPWDLYPQLRFLGPHVMPEDVLTYKKKYFVYGDEKEKVVTGYKNIHILNARVNYVSSTKRLEECVTLPERTFITQLYSLSSAQKKSYNQLVESWAMNLPENEVLETSNGAIRLSKLLQICSGFVYLPQDTTICDTCSNVRKCVQYRIVPGSNKCILKHLFPKGRQSMRYPDNPKLVACKDLIIDLSVNGKCIIWAAMIQELDDIQKMLDGLKIGYVRVDGSNTKNAKNLANIFNTKKDCLIYLAQISTGIAITLNEAQYTINYSRSWSEEQREQSLGRNYRIGQRKKTIVYDLCGKYTIETHQLKALDQKAKVANILTNRIDCVLCSKYAHCVKEDISPWTDECIHKTEMARIITKAKIVR